MGKNSEFEPVFARLRDILRKHSGVLRVEHDTADHFGLAGATGLATIAAWGGKMRSPTIPVAWVEVGKSYVSYHLMGVYGNPKLLEGCSPELRARMQGKSCFNFTKVDEKLMKELDGLTLQSLTGMRKAGFIAHDKGG
jgi:hypothetical protein